MKFPYSIVNVKDYHSKIFELINNEKCKIFIDTNIIALFYGIHNSARKEFFDWLKILINEKRVKVPLWVINEYSNRFIRNQIQDYLNPLKKVSSITKEFENVSAFLKMHIEDSNLVNSKYSTLEEFHSDLSLIQEKLDKIDFTAKNKDEKYKLKIHDEIKQLLESCILNSDIDKILAKVETLGTIRYNNKLPPGFDDAKKELNAHGDLIIWYEILTYCKADNVKKAILITNDEKKDWVYAPSKLLINSKETSNKEPQLKIADPRLVHEFKVATQSEDFYIISFELLTKILIDNISNSFTNLASALQLVHNQSQKSETQEDLIKSKEHPDDVINIEPVQLINAPQRIEAKIETTLTNETNRQGFNYSQFALEDKDFPLVGNAYFTNIIEQLKSYNWYVQNPAIESLLNFDSKAIKESQVIADNIFVIGRNIYQSACGGSSSAIMFIENLRTLFAKFSDYFINHLYSGILYEVYFDSSNNFRGDKLKSYYINEVLEVIDLERLKPSISFIEKALKKYENDLIYLPYKNETVTLTITFDQELIKEKNWLNEDVTYLKLNDIKSNNKSLLTDNPDKALDIYYPDINFFGLISLICKTYGIPSNKYVTEVNPEIDKNLQIKFKNKKLATTHGIRNGG